MAEGLRLPVRVRRDGSRYYHPNHYSSGIYRIPYEELPLVAEWICCIIPSHRPDGYPIVKFPYARGPMPEGIVRYYYAWPEAIPILIDCGVTLGIDSNGYGHTVYVSREARERAHALREQLTELARLHAW